MVVPIINIINESLAKILENRRDVTILACKQRAKFEGWLKFELAATLVKTPGIEDVVLEDSYSSNGRSDISLVYVREKWHIEMKTANTNWRANGLENLTRPITRNMDGIIEDMEILKSKSFPAHGLAVFSIFPIPQNLVRNYPEQLFFHLDRIERETKLETGYLRKAMKYVPLTDTYGIGIFTVQVV